MNLIYHRAAYCRRSWSSTQSIHSTQTFRQGRDDVEGGTAGTSRLAADGHTSGVTTEVANVLLNPDKQRTLVIQAHVTRHYFVFGGQEACIMPLIENRYSWLVNAKYLSY